MKSLLLLVPLITATLAAAERTPLSVRLAPEAQRAVFPPGVPARVSLVLRNESKDQPIVIRSVHWHRGAPDDQMWANVRAGRLTPAARGAFNHDTGQPGFTELMIESGLLLPGEELGVARLFTPQDEKPAGLRVRYVAVGTRGKWEDEVLIQGERRGSVQAYVPATKKGIAARKGVGGLGLARDTMKPFAERIPPMLELDVSLMLPASPDPTFARTGGMAIVEAANRLALPAAGAPWHGVWSGPVETWFFVNGRGEGRALVKVPDPAPRVPPTAPPGFVPKPFRWEQRALPLMFQYAADFFCADEVEGRTRLELDAATFGDVVPVAPARADGLAAETPVPALRLWPVLDRAREKKLELRPLAGGIPPEMRRVLRFLPAPPK